MEVEAALAFLSEHQPLPADSDLSEELITRYNDVRRYFIASPDPRCIPLFLNSFGEGSGFGVYQVVDDVLHKYSAEQVVPHLKAGLGSPYAGVRYWCTHWAADFPSPDLIPGLTSILTSQADHECHYFAVCALEQLSPQTGPAPIAAVLEPALTGPLEPDVRALIEEVLAGLGGADAV
jgi:hypothetical protein